jgi:hypothetical protein
MEDLESVLAQRFATAPVSFTARVLERIAREERRLVRVDPDDVFPWWIRALREPATMLSCLAASLLVAAAPALRAKVVALPAALEEGLGAFPAMLELLPADPSRAWVLALGVLPPLVAGSYLLFRRLAEWDGLHSSR